MVTVTLPVEEYNQLVDSANEGAIAAAKLLLDAANKLEAGGSRLAVLDILHILRSVSGMYSSEVNKHRKIGIVS